MPKASIYFILGFRRLFLIEKFFEIPNYIKKFFGQECTVAEPNYVD